MDHEPAYKTTDYILGILWMAFVFGPGITIIGLIAYAILT